MLCCVVLLTGCLGETTSNNPAFKDVQREPPEVSVEALTYLVQNERDLAEWIEYTADACDQYGCI